jgi:hypothetical protein
MTPTTTEYWDIDGQSLNELAWNIATVGGSRYDLPVRRGENMTFAYRPGSIHRAKLPDARTITLVMWVAGVIDGDISVVDPAIAWNDNWDLLRRTVWSATGSQVSLTRRWWLTEGEISSLVSATAKAEIADAMSPTMTGRTRADFTMTFLLADPFFYGSTITTVLDVATPAVIANPGHDTAMYDNFTITLAGPLTNPRLTNATANPDIWVQYTGTIAGGASVTLTPGAFTAVTGAGVNVINNVTHAGSRHWMGILPGNNTMTLSASAGAGHATVAFKPPYI